MANPLHWIKKQIQGKWVAVFEFRSESSPKPKTVVVKQEQPQVMEIEIKPLKRDWLKEDDEAIERLFCDGKSDSFIADVLQRNPAEVGTRRAKLGFLKRKDENGRVITVCPTRYTD